MQEGKVFALYGKGVKGYTYYRESEMFTKSVDLLLDRSITEHLGGIRVGGVTDH